MPEQQISGQGSECLSAFQSYGLLSTAACQFCPHVGGSCMLCSTDCSNTSCSITEVLDLSPPSPLSHDRVCGGGQGEDVECVRARAYVRVQYTRA